MNGAASTLAFILASVTLNASAQILLRMGARSGIDAGDRGVAASLSTCSGALRFSPGSPATGSASSPGSTVLSRAEASFAYPFLGLGFVIVALAGWLVLGEMPSPRRVAATALIVTGVVLLARS